MNRDTTPTATIPSSAINIGSLLLFPIPMVLPVWTCLLVPTSDSFCPQLSFTHLRVIQRTWPETPPRLLHSSSVAINKVYLSCTSPLLTRCVSIIIFLAKWAHSGDPLESTVYSVCQPGMADLSLFSYWPDTCTHISYSLLPMHIPISC